MTIDASSTRRPVWSGLSRAMHRCTAYPPTSIYPSSRLLLLNQIDCRLRHRVSGETSTRSLGLFNLVPVPQGPGPRRLFASCPLPRGSVYPAPRVDFSSKVLLSCLVFIVSTFKSYAEPREKQSTHYRRREPRRCTYIPYLST